MRNLFAFALVLGASLTLQAQLTWIPCTMPTNTLTDLALGPNGELATFQTTNPIQPIVSVDQGQSWQTHAGVGGPNGNALMNHSLHISITGTLLLWGTNGLSGSVWRSVDGGDTFTQVGSTNGIPASGFYMGFASSPIGDLYLYGEGILRSTDDGQNWTSIVDASTFLTSMAATTTQIWAVQLSAVYRGGLDGSGFAAISTGAATVTNGNGIAIGMNDRIIAVGGEDRVITSTDGGDTWFHVTSGIGPTANSELQHVAASLSSDTWVTGKQISAFYTDNAGEPWVDGNIGLGLAPNEPIQAIFCDPSGTFYLYGYFHLYRSDISTAIADPGTKGGAVLYPNPTDGTVWLPERIAGQSLRVFDMAGREVLRSTADRNGTVDLGCLENGHYFMRSALGEQFGAVHVLH